MGSVSIEGILWRLKECCRKMAEQGDVGAQLYLKMCNKIEKTALKEETEVAKLRKTAERGDVDAQYKLGLCYYHGNDVSQDYKEAMKWFGKAAEQGNEWAQWRLVECCKIMAEQGDTDAKLCLEMYHKRRNGDPNTTEAENDSNLVDFIHKYGHGIWRISKTILENI